MKVLYIEDDQEDRLFFQDVIKSVNPSIDFEAVSSCDEALFKLKTGRRPDLIFLDITMPLKSGQDCLRLIKANPLLSAIPVIIYSASNDKRDIKECMELGASEYMVKPNDFETLCYRLKLILNSSRQ
jgi:CheY-like chemotaxis protein